ncbi:MAG: ABC transporter permease [Deltaproteobacteria bacterium]|nr:ABC transporter permease [Deltaproteobacteria bacterium]
MGLYIIKRILLMVPTFFAISFIVFIILNLAPGNPGAEILGAGDGGQSAQLAGQQQESYRLFKEQFNLDKPILLNTRFAMSTRTVRKNLTQIIASGDEVSAKDKIAAQENIVDWGHYSIPALVEIVGTDPDRSIRALAAQSLALNAQRRLMKQYGGKLTAEERDQNRQISEENELVRSWVYGKDSAADVEADVQRKWAAWFTEHGDRWDWSVGDKAAIFFFDTRFSKYWGNLARLDFGISHTDKRPVLDKVLSKLKYSITLSFTSVILIYLLSVPLGIWSAVKQNTLPDRVLTVVLFMLYSLPSFFVGVFLLNLLTRGTPYQAFPTTGFSSLNTSQMTGLEYLGDVMWHVFLPIVCLSYAGLAVLSRYARTGLLDVIRSDYIRTARAKGLPEWVVIIKHAARNGMIPILTLLASLLPTLIGGSVVIEVIFGIPGMGLYVFESIGLRDYNAVMAVLLISSVLTLIGMLLSDLSYALVDPRITFD